MIRLLPIANHPYQPTPPELYPPDHECYSRLDAIVREILLEQKKPDRHYPKIRLLSLNF